MKKYLSGLTALSFIVMLLVLNACTPNAELEVKEPQGISGFVKKGEIKSLISGEVYILDGPLIVEDGGMLNIAAGTLIKAKKGFSNYILVLQGGKINVNGTESNPVRMTADISEAESGYWGGLIINGKAGLAGGSEGTTEINSDYKYGGGTNPIHNDNSGTLTYLILEYPGARSSADVEHNGLTLNGVGNGTKIENVFILESADDGIELFGGSVNIKNILVVDSDDDMFDFTQGYTGTFENAYGVWNKGFTSTEADPRGIEADGNFDGNFPEQTGQSDFIVKNITIDLRLDYNPEKTTQMQDLFKIRRGARAVITNALVKGIGYVVDLVDFSDSKGAGSNLSSVSLTNMLTNTISGKALNPGKDRNDNPLEYPNVKTDVSGNTGCDTSIFSWTRFEF